MLALGGAAAEGVRARVALAEPGARHEVGRRLLVGLEVAVERQQHEDVLLRVRPAARLAVGEQAGHQLGDEVALRLVGDQRLEQDRVGAAVGVEQQVGAVAVGDREVRGAGGLGDAVRELAADRRDLGLRRRVLRRAAAAASRAPRRRARRRRRLAHERPRPRRIRVAQQRAHVRARRPASVRRTSVAVVARDVPLDLAQVAAASARACRRGPRSPWPSRAPSAWATWMRDVRPGARRRAARRRSRRRRSAAPAAARRRASTAASSSSGFGRPSALNAVSTSRSAATASTREESCSAHSNG